MNAPMRNALVMLPPKLAPADVLVAECPPDTSAQPSALLPGAVELLRITVEAWGPLRESDAVPMPLETRKQWAALRKEYRKQSGRGYIDAENQEWFSLPEELRMVILLLAQVSGNLPDLVGRDWRETPPPERAAIKAATRSLKRHSGRLVALASLW
ncbi:MAG: hypothetical protein AB7U71_15070 [Comamonas sp.]